MVQRINVLPGDRYGSLVVEKEVDPIQRRYGKHRAFEVVCDCGKKWIAELNKLRTGRTISCLACSRERVKRSATTHGMRRSNEYAIWCTMLSRCNNPSCKSYVDYGLRGVTVCDRWDPAKGGSFANFFADMGPRPSRNHQLDKEAVEPTNTVYCPEKVRWATKKENMRHTRRSIFLTYNGKTLLLSEWAEEMGLGVSCLHRRLFKSGWPLEKALTTPSCYRPYKRNFARV